MLVFTMWPVMLGIMATLRVVTGVTKTDMLDAGDEEGEEEGGASMSGLSKSMHTDIEKSTKDVHSKQQYTAAKHSQAAPSQATPLSHTPLACSCLALAFTGYVQKVEAQINDLQRGHDTRFADLHKDLAGIVWELSKLRADMARWQALAQLGVRSKSQSAAVVPGEVVKGGEAPGGARAWRGEGP